MKAMGKDPDSIEQRRKDLRNAKNKEKSKDYEHRLKVNKSNWNRTYNKKKPKKEFNSKFLLVSSWNPFLLEESELVSDEDMKFLFDKLMEAKLKDHANEVNNFFNSNVTRNKKTNWKQMGNLSKKLLGKKLHLVFHPDKVK